ncbi:P1 family peptidase [Sporosarcina ureae]|uniref:DmpA family aminopeptidase n=1 Tax=Sporosarcina ureae TaxID=1571 RepID=UPI0026ED008C|nr:P1 family peptidase [Sporosarcina ureae]
MNLQESKKVRDRGIIIGRLPTGIKNCITDVKGVKVGHVTLDHPLQGDEYVATGVTAILPHGDNLFMNKVVGASYILNGFGKTTGLVQVNELGLIESPIMLTNTFGVPAVTQGTLQYMLEESPEIGNATGTINLVVGECNDSRLNSIRELAVQPSHAIAAIKDATTNASVEGAVGAGKGMICFGYKGGIGSSSRIVTDSESGKKYTLGCIVLSNFGKKEDFQNEKYKLSDNPEIPTYPSPADGSIMIILATDAPLSNRQLRRVAKRCGIGLGRTGSHFSNGSGDVVIAFSTAHKIPHFTREMVETRQQLRDDHSIMNDLFLGAAEVAEEAILNSLSQAITTTGRMGNIVHAYPFD